MFSNAFTLVILRFGRNSGVFRVGTYIDMCRNARGISSHLDTRHGDPR